MNTRANRPRYRANLFYRFTPRFQAGLEWNPGVGEVDPVANWIITPETEKGPLVTVGTSSDRIFSPKGRQAVYATFAKGFPQYRLGPYVGISYSGWEKRFILPFGANLALAPQWDLLGMNDGRNTHVLLTYKMEKASITAMLVKMRYPGVSLGFSF